MIRQLFLASAASSLIAGCATVGPNFAPPKTPPTPSYSMKGDAPSTDAAVGQRLEGDWWALLRSPEIDRTVRAAVAGNRNLEAARQSLAEAPAAIAAPARAANLDFAAPGPGQRANLARFGFSPLPPPCGGAGTLF